jgi:ribose 5-phosphate isomerase B
VTEKRIVAGSDHAGLALKYELLAAMREWGWTAEDLGPSSLDSGVPGLTFESWTGTLATTSSVDYPKYAFAVAERVAKGTPPLGLLVCGSGIGMSIAANKVRGVRAALCHDPYSASMARAHNDANVLCVGGRIVGPEIGKAVLCAFIDGSFEGGRHGRRVDLIRSYEGTGDDRR